MDNEPSSKVVPCKQRKPCLQHCTNDGNIPAKKTRKPPASLPLGAWTFNRIKQSDIARFDNIQLSSSAVFALFFLHILLMRIA